MSNRLTTLIRHDLRMEKSYGILVAYTFVITIYVLILLTASDILPTWLGALIIYTDPTALGFFFLGGMMMLEKSENVRQTLAMTPVSAFEYILSKYITLTVISLIAAIALALIIGNVNLILLILTVIPSSLFFISVGVLVARRMKTVTGYLIGSLPVILPLFLPMFLVVIDPFPHWLNLIPTTAQFWLMLSATHVIESTFIQIGFALTVTILSALAAFWWACHDLAQEFGIK